MLGHTLSAKSWGGEDCSKNAAGIEAEPGESICSLQTGGYERMGVLFWDGTK